MTNKIGYLAAIIVTLVIGYGLGRLHASASRGDFADVQAFAYASGLTGFFNHDTGELYLYDANLSNCFVARKVAKLGDALVKVRDPDPSMLKPLPTQRTEGASGLDPLPGK